MRLNNVQGCSQVLKNFKQNYSGAVLQVRGGGTCAAGGCAAVRNARRCACTRACASSCIANRRAAPAAPAPAAQGVPAAYRVAAHYYLGRTELNSDNIKGALDMLGRAFKECKADSENVKHILRVLIPVSCARAGGLARCIALRAVPQHARERAAERCCCVAVFSTRAHVDCALSARPCPCAQLKMLLGELPSAALLERHGLSEYTPFAAALASGDVGLFDSSMASNQLRLIANGTYLLLEKLRFNVYRQ